MASGINFLDMIYFIVSCARILFLPAIIFWAYSKRKKMSEENKKKKENFEKYASKCWNYD